MDDDQPRRDLLSNGAAAPITITALASTNVTARAATASAGQSSVHRATKSAVSYQDEADRKRDHSSDLLTAAATSTGVVDNFDVWTTERHRHQNAMAQSAEKELARLKQEIATKDRFTEEEVARFNEVLRRHTAPSPGATRSAAAASANGIPNLFSSDPTATRLEFPAYAAPRYSAPTPHYSRVSIKCLTYCFVVKYCI